MTTTEERAMTFNDLADCEWPNLTGEVCERKATTGALRMVLCDQHAAELIEANTWPEEDARYAECQYDTGHPGGICGRRCDGSDYCDLHSPTAWGEGALAERRTYEAARTRP